MSLLLVNGNALKIPLADRSVHCIVTSPPYYSLRDYGIPGQLGLEDSPEAYIARMVEVFRECWRVLRDDGTLWLNIGDSYAGSGGAGGDYAEGGLKEGQPRYEGTARQMAGGHIGNILVNGKEQATSRMKFANLKPKDLIGIPWMLAFALRADGWYLRSEIIWHKPNPMPESATDRPTKAHEQLFLFAKRAHYYYDAEAIREPHSDSNVIDGIYHGSGGVNKDEWQPKTQGWNGSGLKMKNRDYNPSGRNRRSVWTIPTSPYSGAHFATYPPALVEPCIKAGTSERGCCPKCGAPWERVVVASGGTIGRSWNDHDMDIEKGQRAENSAKGGNGYKRESIGWQPTCECAAKMGSIPEDYVLALPPVPAVVFDPFAGSGTTLQVARALGRSAVGLDLSLAYLQECARSRLELDALDAWTNGTPAKGPSLTDLPLFGGEL